MFEIPTNLRAGLWAGLLLRRFDPGQDLPDPDLIIGAGHRTHLPMLRARRARGGRIVVLMRPSLPLSWFDLCLVPAHDRITAGDNVWLTRGALNSIIRSETKDPRSGVILIGGPSKHYLWDEPELLAQIGRVATRLPAVQWRMTDSARTPAATRRALTQLRYQNLIHTPVSETPPGWVTDRLADAAYVWVTADSMSMLYEALTAGAAVGLLDVPARQGGRLVKAIAQLATEGLVVRYQDWQAGADLRRPADAPNEAVRAARHILDRLIPAQPGGN